MHAQGTIARAIAPPSPKMVRARIVSSGSSCIIFTKQSKYVWMSSIVKLKMKMHRIFSVFAVLLLLSLTGGCGEKLGVQAKLSVGDQVPKSNNLTVSDPDKWYEISSMDTKVPLYEWKIADLVNQRKPFLVVFGTPQHCTMCVDQITRVAVMAEQYGERFAFVHVDGYKDTSVWVEWGVTGEPWTYLVDSRGTVRSVFPGQTELGLLTLEIDKILNAKEG